jgi:hypothetical protein
MKSNFQFQVCAVDSWFSWCADAQGGIGVYKIGVRVALSIQNLCGTVYRQGNVVFTPDGNSVLSPVGNRVSVFDLVK